MDRRRIRLRTIWSPPLRSDPRQPATGGRRLRVPARRFYMAGSGAGCSSNRGRIDHRDRGLHAGKFPSVRAPADDGLAARDEPMSLIYSMRAVPHKCGNAIYWQVVKLLDERGEASDRLRQD